MLVRVHLSPALRVPVFLSTIICVQDEQPALIPSNWQRITFKKTRQAPGKMSYPTSVPSDAEELLYQISLIIKCVIAMLAAWHHSENQKA